jgi:CubicO group peptidase (beta-lactamase class C family)
LVGAGRSVDRWRLVADLLEPLGLRDTGLWVSAGSVARLPASYRHTDSGLVELEPAAGGFYAMSSDEFPSGVGLTPEWTGSASSSVGRQD